MLTDYSKTTNQILMEFYGMVRHNPKTNRFDFEWPSHYRLRQTTAMESFCAIWRKGLRRVWNLPLNTDCALVPPSCGLLPLMDEVACRCATFISGCLHSECEVVSFAARHDVYYSRMSSPIGRNSLFCCSRFGVYLTDIARISKSFICLALLPITPYHVLPQHCILVTWTAVC